MPHRREYQCLNEDCKSVTSPYMVNSFEAMNDKAVCPHCDSIKLLDCGVAKEFDINKFGGAVIDSQARENIKSSNANLKRIAERYGMSDMSNKDGRGVKAQPAAQQQPTGPTTKVGGIDIPLSAIGGCVNLPGMATPLKGTWSGAGTPQQGMPNMAGMTNVVGRHDG